MRKLCAAALPFCGAVWLAVTLLPEGCLVFAGCGLLVAALMLRRLEGLWALRLTLAAAGMGAAFLWTAGYQALFLLPARLLDGQEGIYTVTVTGWPEESSYGYRVGVSLDAAGRRLGGLLYTDPEGPELTPGDRLSGTFALSLADEAGGEKSGYYYAQGVLLTLNLKGEGTVDHPETVPLAQLPRWWARQVETAIAARFSAETAPVITALFTGNRSGLPDGVYSDFQRAGAAHVLVVSGLHVSFLTGLLSALLGKRRWWTAAVSLPVLAVFAAVAGCTPSVLRAVFLQGFVLLAPVLGREVDRPTALTAALTLLLLANPYAAGHVGLQLSFAAVAGIYLLTDPLMWRWTKKLPRRPVGWWRKGLTAGVRFVLASVAATVGALAFTTPLTIYYFGVLSLAAPLTNLLLLWAVSLLFQLAAAALAVGALLPPVGQLLALPAEGLARYVLWITRTIGRFPWSAVEMKGIYLWLWLGALYAVGVLALVWKKGREGVRPVLPGCALVCLLCLSLVCTAAETRLLPGVLAVLDVGQGQSVALCAQDRTVLIDCGGSGSVSAGDVAANYFQSAGYPYLDVLILTHYHADHTNGVARLLERMRVGALVAPDVEPESASRQALLALAEEAGCEVVLLSENGRIALDELTLFCCGPLGAGESNEEGLSVVASFRQFTALVTGDMGADIEKRLVKYGNLPAVTVLVAGHHGSRYSTSQLLLDTVDPVYAVISVGTNSYGQPAGETLERLSAQGCTVCRTDQMGTVRFPIR